MTGLEGLPSQGPEQPAFDPEVYRQQYRARIRKEAEEDEQEFLRSFTAATETDPDLHGEAMQIGRELGLPPEAVSTNLDVARATLAKRSLEQQEMRRRYPILFQNMAQNHDFRRIAHDDLRNLQTTESTWGILSRKWDAGLAINERGLIGARRAVGDIQPGDEARLAEIDQLLSDAGRDSGVAESVSEILGQMSGTLPVVVGAGLSASGAAALGGPVSSGTAGTVAAGAALFTTSGLIEGGNAYLDMVGQGYDENTSALAALGVGVVNGALETISGGVAAKPFRAAAKPLRRLMGKEALDKLADGLRRDTAGEAFGTFVREYATSFATEVSTEVLQEAVNIAGDEVARYVSRPDMQSRFSTTRGWQEMGHQFSEIFSKTAMGMGVLAAPGPLMHYASNAIKARVAARDSTSFDALLDADAASKVRLRDPDSYGDYVDELARVKADGKVYIDGAAFKDTMRQTGHTVEQLGVLSPEAARQVEQAAQTGEDVVLPAGEFHSKFVESGLGRALKPHVRLDPDGPSFAEAEQFEQAIEELRATANKEQSEQDDVKTATLRSAIKVEDRVRGELMGTGRMAEPEARAAAKVHRDFVLVQSGRLQITPEQFDERYPLSVRFGEADATESTVQQTAAPDTPETAAAEAVIAEADEDSVVLFHSGDASQAGDLSVLVEPQFGPWLEEVLSLNVDNEDLAQAIRDGPKAAFFSERPNWVAMKVARAMGKYVSDVTLEDVRRHGHVSIVVVDRSTPTLRRSDGQGRSTQFSDPTDIEEAPFGVESSDIFATDIVDTSASLTGEALIEFLRRNFPEELSKLKGGDTATKANPNDPNVLRQTGRRYRKLSSKERAALHVSPAMPSSVKGDKDPGNVRLPMLDYASQPEGRVAFNKNVAQFKKRRFRIVKKNGVAVQVRGYDSVKPTGRTPQQQAESIIRQMVRNLVTLYDRVPKAVRNRSRKWYDGAHKMANQFAERYDLTVQQVAGVFAVLSPNADWRMNVSYAERILDTLANFSDTKATAKMDKWLRAYANSRTKASGKKTAHAARRAIKGKKLSQISDPVLASYWIRAHDETTNSKSFRDLSPEGEFLGFVKKKDGEASEMTWTSFDIMSSALQIVRDGSRDSISQALGAAHKVRNFYNNILDPKSKRPFVTSDTHQVAANMMMPLGSSAVEVAQNLGGTGSAKNAELGLSGTYWLHHEAVARAAAKRGVLPREMQSITWEAVRALFSPAFKRDVASRNKIRDLWKAHHDGKLSYAKTISAIFDLAGGLDTPAWASQRPGSGQSASDGHSSYDGVVPAARLRGRPSGGARRRGAAGGARANRSARFDQTELAPEQGAALRSRGEGSTRGFFDTKRLVATLTSSSNASTFFHESAHYYLTVLADMASRPDAPAQVTEDMDALLSWFGTLKDAPDSLAAWNAMSIDQQRKFHEAFALSFEQYLSDGVAPTLAMQSLFDRFAAWLRRIYTSIREELNAIFRDEFKEDLPVLTGEVRQVMDRMLASQEAIEHAEEARGLGLALLTEEQAKGLGVTAEQWAEYQKALNTEDDHKVQELSQAMVSQLRWFTGAKGKHLRAMQRETEAIRAAVRSEVQAELESEPVYAARRLLRDGIDADGQPVEGPHRLDTELTRALLRDDEDLTAFRSGNKPMTMVGGLNPETVAQVLGFEGGGPELVRALIDAPKLQEAVEARTDERMLAEFSELQDPEYREQVVLRALHTEARARIVAQQVKFMAKATTPVRLFVQAARDLAGQILLDRRMGDISARQFALAEGRAAKRAKREMGKTGDPAKALEAQRQRLLQHELARRATEIHTERLKEAKKWRRFAKSDKELAKTRDVDLIAAGRAVLALHQVEPWTGQAGENPLQHLLALQQYNPDRYAEVLPIVTRSLQEGRRIEDLTLSEFRVLTSTLDEIWHHSGAEKKVEVDGKRKLVNEAVQEMLSTVEIPKVVPGDQAAPTGKDDAVHGLRGLRASLTRMEHWVTKMDGGRADGPWARYLFSGVREALTRYRRDRNKHVRRLVELVKELDLPSGLLQAKHLGYTFGNESGGVGKAALLGALVHAGNDSNFKKLLVGRGWGRIDEDTGTLDTRAWDAQIDQFVKDGVLTEKDFDFAQAVWDLNDELKPQAQRAHREVFGYFFREVKARSFTRTFKDGTTKTYRGGYVPAKVDARVRSNTGPIERATEFQRMMPAARSGFTKERNEHYADALVLDVRAVANHIDEVLLFSHVEPRLKDVRRLLNNKQLNNALTRIDPTAIPGVLKPWMERAASQTLITDDGTNPIVSGFFRAVRRNTGAAIMFANVVNTLQQLTGLANALLYVRVGSLVGGFGRWASNPRELARDIAKKSEFMDERMNNQVFEMREELQKMLLDPSAWSRAKQWTTKRAYIFQATMQNQVDAIVWQAAYNESIQKQGASVDEVTANREAVKAADRAVRLSQGSFDPEDVARYEQGNAFQRTFTQFTSYFNVLFNQIAAQQGLANKAKATVIAFTIPMLAAEAIAMWLYGRHDEDEDDPIIEPWVDWFFGSQVRGAAAIVPGFGPAMVDIAERVIGTRNKFGGVRGATSPGISTFVRAVEGVGTAFKRSVMGEEVKDHTIRDVYTAIALATSIPVTGATRLAEQLIPADQ